MNHILLHKTTSSGNTRYYSIGIIPTLFNKYGNIRFQACTGKKCNEFLNYDEALSLLNKIKDKKSLYPKNN
ncbi:polymerase [Campylobacter aviculae]|uniref:Polymerase n=1 Tax=Campylobacter aviculae TaxID=2510190 RepID=A0A4U7BK19_9BACT|nr:polymerase [Campylobacter aviculae]